MEKLCENRFAILNATHIKILALIFMTIDHIGYYGFNTPPVSDYYSILRLIGRIAAPLFLYFVVKGVKHTRNKNKYLLRLYTAAICIEICNKLISKILFNSVVFFGNILFTFTWIVLLIVIIDKVIEYLKSKNALRALILIVFAILFIVSIHFIENAIQGGSLLSKILKIFICSPGESEYSLIFILVGIAWYYTKSRITHCLILLIPCLISIFGLVDGIIYCNFARSNQWSMIFALPIILLYNGKRGKGMKYLFYFYYPIHSYILASVFWFLD